MPTYTIMNTETNEEMDTMCSWDELEAFLEEHPAFKSVVTAPALISGVEGRSYRTDDGFKENMSRIAEAHPNSPLADKFGSNRAHKEINTMGVLNKHKIKSIGKSHDLTAIAREYRQGQLVK